MHKTSSAVFAELTLFLFFEDAEGFGRKILAVNIFGIEDIAKFVTGNTINAYLFKPMPFLSQFRID
jgi:hypothetical protein